MSTLNEVKGLVTGQYGTAKVLTIITSNGQPVNISTYTGISLKARSPDAQTTLTFTGTLVGGGLAGKFSFTPGSGNTFDRPGNWEAQVELTTASILDKTVPFILKVEKEL